MILFHLILEFERIERYEQKYESNYFNGYT